MLNDPPPLPISPPPEFLPNKPKIFFQSHKLNGKLNESNKAECNNNNNNIKTVNDRNVLNLRSPGGGDSAFGSQTSIDQSNSSSNGSQERNKHNNADCYVLPDRIEKVKEEKIFEPRPACLKQITPSITTLKPRLQHKSSVKFKEFNQYEKNNWLSASDTNGFIRLFDPTSNLSCSLVIPCDISTTCNEIASKLGLKSDALHVQYGGDLVRRMLPSDQPMQMQNEYLRTIGVDDELRRREMGDYLSLGYMIRFFAGRPYFDDGFGQDKLSVICNVRKGRVFHHWSRRLCVLCGTRIIIYQGVDRVGCTEVILLSRAKVEEVHLRSRGRCIKLSVSSSRKPASYIYLSFDCVLDLNAWIARCVKAAAKVPPICDLSSLQLECLPEQVFCVGSERLLTQLNLKHNNLKERQINADPMLNCWLNDLSRLQSLRCLNLADNSLARIPNALFKLPALTELNLSSNKISEIPECIGKLKHLQTLNLNNNLLNWLPSQIADCRALGLIDLSFNRFTTTPDVLSQIKTLQIWILAGNEIQSFDPQTMSNPTVHMKKLDLRRNELVCFGGHCLNSIKMLTTLDIRDNHYLKDLDLTSLQALQVLACERTSIETVLLNGIALNSVTLKKNKLKQITVMPVPTNLKSFDVSNNKLTRLPDWITELDQLETLSAAHNAINSLPQRLFVSLASLKMLRLNHNRISELPSQIENCFIEELFLHHNKLTKLPADFLVSTHKLRTLNLSQNYLTTLPVLNPFTDLNKVQHLLLTANRLNDSVLQIITGYRRLRVLDISYNYLAVVTPDIERLTFLEELNLSGNRISHLPVALASLPNLSVLRVHSNKIFSIPNFSACQSLKLLDIGNNNIEKVDIRYFLAPNIKHLDLACNQRLHLNANAFNDINRMISLVDMSAENGAKAEKAIAYINENINLPWFSGFAESSGVRNKLCIAQVREPYIQLESSSLIVGGLFGIIDGGLSDQITNQLCPTLAEILKEESKTYPDSPSLTLYNTLLTGHRSLGEVGQKVAASCAMVYITCLKEHVQKLSSDQDISPIPIKVHCASVGHSEVVVCRNGKAVTLTKSCLIADDTQLNREEYARIKSVGGIVTEGNEVDGVCSCSRMLGCSFLYPKVIPTPYNITVKLNEQDEFLIIGSKGLWEQMSHTEAVSRVRNISNPIQAAKHLQDIAQSYGFNENLSVLVIRFQNGLCQPIAEFQPDNIPKSLMEAKMRLEARSASNICDLNEEISTDDEVRSEPRRPPKERPNYYFMYKTKMKNSMSRSSSSTLSEGVSSLENMTSSANSDSASTLSDPAAELVPSMYNSDPTLNQCSYAFDEIDMDEAVLDMNPRRSIYDSRLSHSTSSIYHISLEDLRSAALVSNFTKMSPNSRKCVRFKEDTSLLKDEDSYDELRLISNKQNFEAAKKVLLDKLTFIPQTKSVKQTETTNVRENAKKETIYDIPKI